MNPFALNRTVYFLVTISVSTFQLTYSVLGVISFLRLSEQQFTILAGVN